MKNSHPPKELWDIWLTDDVIDIRTVMRFELINLTPFGKKRRDAALRQLREIEGVPA